MNAAQVRSKARAAMKRREEEVEQEEIEGGEINLIPYLDIVTNLMLFLLASISAGLILGQLNTTLPDQSRSQTPAQDDPNKSPDEKPLKLAVAVTSEEIILFSFTGLEGTLEAPKERIPRVADVGNEVKIPAYDYKALNAALFEIASRRWKDKPRALLTYQAILMADPDIPYGTIISTMDAMRCLLAPDDPPPDYVPARCFFPSDEEEIKQASNPINTVSALFDPKRVNYNPSPHEIQGQQTKIVIQHPLFHDILFYRGF